MFIHEYTEDIEVHPRWRENKYLTNAIKFIPNEVTEIHALTGVVRWTACQWDNHWPLLPLFCPSPVSTEATGVRPPPSQSAQDIHQGAAAIRKKIEAFSPQEGYMETTEVKNNVCFRHVLFKSIFVPRENLHTNPPPPSSLHPNLFFGSLILFKQRFAGGNPRQAHVWEIKHVSDLELALELFTL